MSPVKSLRMLDATERNRLESLLLEFEGDWKSESLAKFEQMASVHPNKAFRHVALMELVKIDMQRRWSIGEPRRLETYLEQYSQLGDSASVPAELVAAEFEARRNTDSDLSWNDYAARFPKQCERAQVIVQQWQDSLDPGASDSASLGTPRAADSQASLRTHPEELQASIDTSRVDKAREPKPSRESQAKADLPLAFGRYRILKELGAGAMGKVYLAHDEQLERRVALKTPNFSGSNDGQMVARFYREARAAAKLQHRNICPIYDVGEIGGRHFISMAFVKGRCMSEYIRPDKLPSQRTSALLVQRLAMALSEAHQHKIIHRDLKPANIMIDLKKEPIVMDFGLARQTDIESRVTRSGMSVGTPAYMSPEQIHGELDEVGPQADIYALGVILYELLTGQLPFRGPIAKVVYSIVHEQPSAPSAIRDEIDSGLEAICLKMMAKDCNARFQCMDDVALALKGYLTSASTANAPKSSPTNPSASAQTTEPALTETGELSVFFATPAQDNPLGTMVESASVYQSAKKSVARKNALLHSGRRRSGNRILLIASGLAGGLILLLGIIIYFKGGKIELDGNSDAVVKVDEAGNVTIQPRSHESSEDSSVEVVSANSENVNTSTVDPPSAMPSARVFESSPAAFDPVPQLLNEWSHFGGNFTNGYVAALAPDGDRVAHRIGNGLLRISDITSIRDLEVPAEMEDAISLAFSADGRLIATGHEDKRVRLWNADTFAPFGKPFESPIEPKIGWVFLSGDATRLIAMASDSEEKLRGMGRFLSWEIATGELISRFRAEMDDLNFARRIAASNDGRRVAVVSLRDGISYWDTTSGQRLPVKFNIPDNITSRRRVMGIDISADGSRLAYGVLNGASSYAAILDTSTGQQLWNSGRQDGRVHTVQFSGDDKWLASTAAREQATQLSLWDVNTGKEKLRWLYKLKTPHEHADRVKFLSFSGDDSRILLAGSFMPVVVWRIKSASPPRPEPTEPPPASEIDNTVNKQ
jgi:serine/threonine protein kinase